MSDCGCELEESAALEHRTLRALLAINGVMFIIEAIVGWWAESAGLLADSLDMLADAFVYVQSRLKITKNFPKRLDPLVMYRV